MNSKYNLICLFGNSLFLKESKMEKAFALRKYGIVSLTIMADTNNKISQMNIALSLDFIMGWKRYVFFLLKPLEYGFNINKDIQLTGLNPYLSFIFCYLLLLYKIGYSILSLYVSSEIISLILFLCYIF